MRALDCTCIQPITELYYNLFFIPCQVFYKNSMCHRFWEDKKSKLINNYLENYILPELFIKKLSPTPIDESSRLYMHTTYHGIPLYLIFYTLSTFTQNNYIRQKSHLLTIGGTLNDISAAVFFSISYTVIKRKYSESGKDRLPLLCQRYRWLLQRMQCTPWQR